MMKRLLFVFFAVFHLVLLLPFSSENTSSQANGTRGAPWLWRCHHTFSEQFQPEKSLIYWQGQNNSATVVYMYNSGKADFEYQSKSFKNRTKIFPDQLSYGNFSLVIEELILKDDQTSLEVVFKGPRYTKKLCQITVYVAAPFQEPKLEIDQTYKTATCSTKGGYPQPEIKWTCQDGGTRPERTLEQHEYLKTNMTPEKDGTYSISSTANITGSQEVTCGVHNPTSNQTVSVTKDTTVETTPPENRHFHGTVVAVCIALLIISLYFYYKRTSNLSLQLTENLSSLVASGDSTDRNAADAADAPSNILSVHGVCRDGATDSATYEDC